MSTSFKVRWRKKIEADLEDLAEVGHDDPFEGWENNRMPESSAEDELFAAMDLLCTGFRPKLAKVFLERCIAVCDKAFSESKLSSALCANSFPLNRGHMLRCDVYARALLGNVLFDLSKANQAAHDIVEYCRATDIWDDQMQAYLLGAIRLATLSGDRDFAISMLSTKKKFSGHAAEARLLGKILLRDPVEAGANQELRVFFDRVRNPDYTPPTFTEIEFLRLDIAAIQEALVRPKTWARNFRKIVQAISA